MKNADSHIYLYAKGHYQRGNLIEDLKKIFGERSAIDPEYYSVEDILHVLLGIVCPRIESSYYFREFILDLLPINYWRLDRGEYDFEHAVIYKCLSVLRMTQVKEGSKILIELDDPDPDILPLTKHNNKEEK